MSRQRMVTRTITTTVVDVMTVDTTAGTTSVINVVIPQTYSDEKKLLKALQSQYDTDTVKCVSIINQTPVETIYGMPETDFIKSAHKLDPETRKMIEE